MKVISLVPSWTETLLEAGVEVVGRTRYCIHPQDKVKPIPVVGGTKDADWELIRNLKADVLLLDREENTLEMAQNSPLKVFDTHVSSLESLEIELRRLSKQFSNSALAAYADRLQTVRAKSLRWSWNEIPGFIKWINAPATEPKNFAYLIWRKPWMAANHGTFISSQLELLGAGELLLNLGFEKYPKFELEKLNPKTTLLLCSSEPYPFEKHLDKMQSLPFSSVLVDGESLSWFGIRAIKFLESKILLTK